MYLECVVLLFFINYLRLNYLILIYAVLTSLLTAFCIILSTWLYKYRISSINTPGILLFSHLKSNTQIMPQCGTNQGCATIFTHVKIIFNISINKATDIVTTEI